MTKAEKPFMVRKTKAKEEPETKKASSVSKEKKTNEKPSKEPKKVAKKAPIKEKKAKETKSSVVANKRVVNAGEVGKKEEDILSILNRHKENKTILWGMVVGSEIDELVSKVFVRVQYKNVTVFIPDTGYFDNTYSFGEEYNKLSKQERAKERKKAVNLTLGSNCPFILNAVQEREIEDGNYKGETEIIAYGSRLDALEARRDKFFLHKHTNEPVNVNINDQVEANVIQVSEKFAVIEVLGVEYRLDCYNLKEGHVDSCKDHVSNGDVIKVRIKKIRIEGTIVTIKVTGRLNLGAKESELLKIGGEYVGEVESANYSSQIITVRLFNGAVATVPMKGGIQGHLELTIGDRVAVYIKEAKEEGYYFGLAMKI